MSALDSFSVVTFPWGREEVTIDGLVEVARHAESLGFHSINLPFVTVSMQADAVFSAMPHHHILDTVIAMTAMVQGTSRIRIASDAFPLTLLPPYHWAKTIATLDHMSGGRIIAGLCPGYGDEQFSAYSARLDERGPRCEEQLEIIKGLRTEEQLTYPGAHYRLERMTCEPKPVQKPFPPIWWAGGLKSVGRAARHAELLDLFLPTLDEIRDQFVPKLERARERWGGDTKLATWIYADVSDGESWSAGRIDRRFAGYYFDGRPFAAHEVAVAGSPQQCVDRLGEYRDAGINHFVLDFQNHGVDPVPTAIEQMSRFAETVAPRLG